MRTIEAPERVVRHEDVVIVKSSRRFNFATEIEYEVYEILGRTFLSRSLISQFKSEDKLCERLNEENPELAEKFETYLETGERQGFRQMGDSTGN